MTRLLALAALVVSVSTAVAQPGTDKVDAKALMQSGVKLFQAKDYLGALAVFKDAYKRFPSTKILLNIGTTLKLLDRDAEAANVYQQYIDATDADPAKRVDAQTALDAIDKTVGRIELAVTPADAEIQVGDADWGPAGSQKLVRVAPGPFTIRARKTGFQTAAKSASIEAADKQTIAIALVEDVQPVSRPTGGGNPFPGDGVSTVVQPPAPLSRFGAFGLAHLDFPHSGGAALIGVSVDATEQLSLRGAAILGPSYGAFAGATFAILTGSLRPTLSAGMPIFFSNGARYAVRGAAGLEVVATRHLSLILELGVEHDLNPEMGIQPTLFIPAVGVGGRL